MSDTVDPTAAPGSYEKQGDSFVRTEEATAAAQPGRPPMDAAAAQTLAGTFITAGLEVPGYVAAALPAPSAAAAPPPAPPPAPPAPYAAAPVLED